MEKSGTRGSVEYRLMQSHWMSNYVLRVQCEDLYWNSYVRGQPTNEVLFKLVDEGKRAIADKIREKLCA